jgi:hypothetical protein
METDMAGFFRAPDRRQLYLLPVDMMDWLPSGDIVHWVVDAVELMDLSAFEAEHRVGGAGQAPIDPKVPLALSIYAYSPGVRNRQRPRRRVWRGFCVWEWYPAAAATPRGAGGTHGGTHRAFCLMFCPSVCG